MNWKYHFTTYLDPMSGELKLQEKGMARFPGTENEWQSFVEKSRKIALYWRGMEYDIFPLRAEDGTIRTDIHLSEREKERIRRDRENLCSWMVE